MVVGFPHKPVFEANDRVLDGREDFLLQDCQLVQQRVLGNLELDQFEFESTFPRSFNDEL